MHECLTRAEVEQLVRAILQESVIEPLYPLAVAAEMVPCHAMTLGKWLKRGGFEARYAWRGTTRHRMVPADQIRWVRATMIRPKRLTGLPFTAPPGR